MAAVRYVLVLSVAFGLVYASSDDAVDNFFGSDDECKNNCAKTYASLTDENVRKFTESLLLLYCFE